MIAMDGGEAADGSVQTQAPSDPPVADELDLGYRVELDTFTGPLDLLLYLVRRAEVDVTDIPVATIADQFIATIEAWDAADLDIAGDFILMAASLLELKARLVAPPLDDEEEDEQDEEDLIDPRADLIRQLLAFRRVKEAIQELQSLQEQRLRLHQRRFREELPADPDEAEGMDLENADPYQLYRAWERVLLEIAGHRQRTVVYDDVPIDERMRQLERTMREAREAQLAWLMEREEKPVQRCGLLVAVLECVRQRVLEASQYEQYGSVYLRYQDEDDRRHEHPISQSDAEEGTPRRRGRRPLVTWRPPDGTATEAADDHFTGTEEEDDLFTLESDLERFQRELNEDLGIDLLIDRAKRVDEHLHEHLVELGLAEPHPEDADSEEATESPPESAADHDPVPAHEAETETETSHSAEAEPEPTTHSPDLGDASSPERN